MHTFASLTADLEKTGLQRTDTVIVHSSMKSIGPVEGGADTVLDVLMAYFGQSGLLVLPTLTHSIVNTESPAFNVRDSECSTGILPQLFRKRPGVIRSLHPTHSLAAFGPDAAAFTAGHELADSPAPRQSPWGRLYDRNAHVLFIGITILSNTFLHGVEEWLPVPGMLTESHQPLRCIDVEGKVHATPMRRHVGGHSRFYDRLEALYRDQGALRETVFGNAHCFIEDCRTVGDVTYAFLQRNPYIFCEDPHPRS